MPWQNEQGAVCGDTHPGCQPLRHTVLPGLRLTPTGCSSTALPPKAALPRGGAISATLEAAQGPGKSSGSLLRLERREAPQGPVCSAHHTQPFLLCPSCPHSQVGSPPGWCLPGLPQRRGPGLLHFHISPDPPEISVTPGTPGSAWRRAGFQALLKHLSSI